MLLRTRFMNARKTARLGSPCVQALLLLGSLAPAACSDHKGPGEDDATIETVGDAAVVSRADSAVGQPEFPNDPLDGGGGEQADASSATQSDATTGDSLDAAAVGQDAAAGQDGSLGGELDASQAGSDAALPTTDGAVPFCSSGKVDLLFVIDNSGSMAEEQKKLAAVLPQLVTVLTTGHLTPAPIGTAPDFPPIRSLHVGITSADMAVNLAPSPVSCGVLSFNPIAPDPSNDAVSTLPPSNGERLVKPFGDDGLLNISTAVAVAGISARPFGTTFATPVSVVVPPDPACGSHALPASQRFLDFNAGSSNATVFAQQFSCLAKLGKNGCGIEQQLEAMLKAVTPSTSATLFSRNTRGHGDVANRGFLRDDAALVVVVVSDEEDCSIPDSSSELMNQRSTTITEDINIRCGLTKYETLLQPIARYVEGLRALKPAAYVDRIVFAGIVGVPMVPGKKTYRGSAEMQALLNNPAMVFTPRPIPGSMNLEATPSCVSASGDGTAAPARRMVRLAERFGANGLVTSICEDEYGPAMAAIAERIAVQQHDVCQSAP